MRCDPPVGVLDRDMLPLGVPDRERSFGTRREPPEGINAVVDHDFPRGAPVSRAAVARGGAAAPKVPLPADGTLLQQHIPSEDEGGEAKTAAVVALPASEVSPDAASLPAIVATPGSCPPLGSRGPDLGVALVAPAEMSEQKPWI